MRKRTGIRPILALALVLLFAGCGTKNSSDEVPHFGSGKTDYDGFQYLEQTVLRLDNKNVTVYIPNKEHLVLQETYVSSGKMGIFLEIDIDPYGGEAKYATAEENLKAELESYFEENNGASYFLDAEMGDIQVNRDGSQAAGTISYFGYDHYKESYSYKEDTMVLYQLDEDFFVKVWIMAGGEEICEETEGLVAELEEFYQVNLPWNNEAAQAKLDSYVQENASAFADEETPDTPDKEKELTFDIPEGWEEIAENGVRFYAPEGGLDAAGCFIQVQKEYVGEDLSYMQSVDFGSEEFQGFLGTMLGLSEETFSTSAVECNLGIACCIEFGDGDGRNLEAYMIFGEDGNIHYIMGGYEENRSGAREKLQEALKLMLDTAELV